LSRANEPDLMAAPEQRFDHETHGTRNAVDFRRIGLGDNRNAKGAPRPSRFYERIHARAQCARDMKPG